MGGWTGGGVDGWGLHASSICYFLPPSLITPICILRVFKPGPRSSVYLHLICLSVYLVLFPPSHYFFLRFLYVYLFEHTETAFVCVQVLNPRYFLPGSSQTHTSLFRPTCKTAQHSFIDCLPSWGKPLPQPGNTHSHKHTRNTPPPD